MKGCLKDILAVTGIAMAIVWFFGLRPPGVATATLNPEAYRALVGSLAERAEAEDTDYVFFRESPEGEIGERMEALDVACVLYVHRAWGRLNRSTQRGIVVAGDVPRLLGGAKVRAYKLVDGRFEQWTEEERPYGPSIYHWRNPMEYDVCETSG